MICNRIHSNTFIAIAIPIITLFSNHFTLMNAEERATLIKCKNADVELNDTLEIPKHLMEPEITTAFKLSNDSDKMNCAESEYKFISLMVNESLHDADKQLGVFTPDGILMAHTAEAIDYRHIRDYCIVSSNGQHLNVSVCPLNCRGDKTLGSANWKPCIHKCCPNPHEIFYLDQNRDLGCRIRNTSKKDQMLNPLLVEVNRKFNLPQLDPRVTPNYFTHKKFPYCDAQLISIMQVPKNIYYGAYHNDYNVNVFRLSKNGSIEMCSTTKRWVEYSNDDVCVEAIQNFGHEHESSGDITTMLVIRCNPPTHINDHNQTKEKINSGTMDMGNVLLYYFCLPVACLFLLVTISVYILLWDKQNIHGKTILSYIVSLFLFFFFLILTKAWELKSKLCYLNAVLAHFFFVLTFSWLTAINFDIYWTFRKLQLSSTVNNNRQFVLYTVICWTAPLIFIIIGISLDKNYGNTHITTCAPEDETSTSWIITPQYGVKSCYISESAEGWYDYFIAGILLGCNVVFFNLTVYRLCQHRKTANPAKKSSSREDKPIMLFGKLLAVMGAGWIFDFIGWALKRNFEGYKGIWLIVAICDFVTILQAVALFYIFVCKKQIFVQLWQKYDKLRWILSVFTRGGCCEVPSDRKNTLNNTTNHTVSGTLGRSTLDASESTKLTNITNRSRKESLD